MGWLWDLLFGKMPESGPLLRKGSSGDEVKDVQGALNSRGANLKVDGLYGKLTTDEVKKFQRENGLVEDGIVGKHTRRAMRR